MITEQHQTVAPARRQAAAFGAVTGLISAFVPMSYDEAYWLGVARLVETGRVLYEGAIDNKTPPVYALVWLLDRLPGPYELWRGAAVGLLGFWLVCGLVRLGRGPRSRTFALLLAAVAVLLAELQLAVELVAATLLTFALRPARRSGTLRAVLALVAQAFDPRTLLLLPGLALVAGSDLPPAERRRLRRVLTTGTVAGVATVLAVPALRYGLVELNLSSRATDFTPGLVQVLLGWAVPLAALLPVIPSVDIRSADLGRRLLLVGAILIPLASILPIPHYFIYVPLALAPLLRSSVAPLTPRIAVAVSVLAIMPLLVNLGTAVQAHRHLADASQEAASVLRAALAPGDEYVVFGSLPHLAVELPAGYALRAPTSLYLSFSTSQSDEHRRELAGLLDRAAAVVDDGALDAPRDQIYPRQRAVYDLFSAALPAFSCTRAGQGFTVRLRPEACEAP